MEKVKKSEVITFRTTEVVKEKLEQLAKEKEWSVSQLCERIIANYVEKL